MTICEGKVNSNCFRDISTDKKDHLKGGPAGNRQLHTLWVTTELIRRVVWDTNFATDGK